MDLKRALSVAIAAAVALAVFVIPATAHQGPGACVLAASPAQVNNVEYGTLTNPADKMSPTTAGHTNPAQKRGEGGRYGLYYPVTDPVTAHWTQTGTAPNHGVTGTSFKGDHFNWKQVGGCANGGQYSASGTGLGYCGRSIGLGSGSITVGGVTHTTTIKWESAGSQLILTDTTAAGSVNAQANPPGSPNGSCLDGGASVFIVDGALVHN